MNVLVVGSGGREHAIAWALGQNSRVKQVFCAPGNPGTARLGENLPILSDDVGRLVRAAEEYRVDLTVVGPEVPLLAGLADRLRKAGHAVLGPGAAAARIEGSKAWSKELMRYWDIPTPEARIFEGLAEAESYLKTCPLPVVVKADGLAAGKGVAVARTRQQALAAVDQMMRRRVFGASGDRVLVEECLAGPELSLLVITDGRELAVLPPARDHKRLLDGDQGPNTGGMGAFSPVEGASRALIEDVTRRVIRPALRAIAQETEPYRGILYAGLMLVNGSPYVLEFNCRLGDPEAQVILPLLGPSFLDLALAAASGSLSPADAYRYAFPDRAAGCVVLAASGYPESPRAGDEITGVAETEGMEGVLVFHAGTELKDGRLVTRGGRVLGVTGTGRTREEALSLAYRAAERIQFNGKQYRRDIGQAPR